jgi:hypothetical protein
MHLIVIGTSSLALLSLLVDIVGRGVCDCAPNLWNIVAASFSGRGHHDAANLGANVMDAAARRHVLAGSALLVGHLSYGRCAV